MKKSELLEIIKKIDIAQRRDEYEQEERRNNLRKDRRKPSGTASPELF